MPMLRFMVVALLTGSFAVLPGTGAIAEPLDKEACLDLQRQRAKLLTRDMQAALERGPDWVKEHLDTVEIEKVREFLGIEEMLEFRCRGGGVTKPVASPADAGAVPLPDRKPVAPPSTVTAGSPDMPLPDRKPGSSPPAMGDVEPSQAVADSDKTPPTKTEATR
jgi:hypothetical protein